MNKLFFSAFSFILIFSLVHTTNASKESSHKENCNIKYVFLLGSENKYVLSDEIIQTYRQQKSTIDALKQILETHCYETEKQNTYNCSTTGYLKIYNLLKKNDLSNKAE